MSHALKDVYASVTNTIIAALEAGTPPWVHPWQSGGLDHRPANLGSGRPYRGINVLLLNLQVMQRGYGINRWLTYQQAKALGAQVRKGEHGTEVVFFKMLELAGQDRGQSTNDDPKVVPLIRSFTVFNADQIDGLPESLLPEPTVIHEWEACDAAETIIRQSGAVVRHGGARAFYSPQHDVIQLPDRSAFVDASRYYQVALHELTHWTGSENRCNRPLLGRQHIEAYAFEELCAELGSAFLTDYCGLPGVLHHASYIESWLAALRNDKKLIFAAASQAQKAADYLLPAEDAAAAVMQAEQAIAA